MAGAAQSTGSSSYAVRKVFGLLGVFGVPEFFRPWSELLGLASDQLEKQLGGDDVCLASGVVQAV